MWVSSDSSKRVKEYNGLGCVSAVMCVIYYYRQRVILKNKIK